MFVAVFVSIHMSEGVLRDPKKLLDAWSLT